jgi:CubicO group peptidase (beta-lactamase class C family)
VEPTTAFPDARGGLVSTADDYLAFDRMMLDGGDHGGERILSRVSVELMTTDHLTPELRATSDSVPDFLGGAAGGSACPPYPAATA